MMFDLLRERVWLGITVVNQDEADRDIPKLMNIPAAVRWLSVEPLLGPLSLRWLPAFPVNGRGNCLRHNIPTDHLDGLRQLDWVVVGGESGHGARPMDSAWVTKLRDQCQEAGTAFFFKQWGGAAKDKGGCVLGAGEAKAWPVAV
jgi:protein gp37